MRASESSVAADPLRSRTASHSGAERRSSTDVRSMNVCRSASWAASTSLARKSTTWALVPSNAATKPCLSATPASDSAAR